jgi:hypothetical protein
MAGEGGAPDCMTLGDCCPTDATKTEPGQCGCGTPDTDADSDGTADCLDLCPMDDQKTVPGACGCGVAGTDADCQELKDALIHRYPFSGTGTAVTDSKGTAHATVQGTGASLSGGKLKLSGGVAPANDPNKAYVELPTSCLSGLIDATFEAWLEWSTTCSPTPCTDLLPWQRVFDFGETATTTAGSYLFLSTRSSTNDALRAAATTAGGNNEATTGFVLDGAMLSASSHHYAVVVDGSHAQALLYMDGVLAKSGPSAAMLSSIVSTNCWLGRSQFSGDPYLNGTFDEFRIYDAALSAGAIAQSYASGPDAAFF